jgi:hypothetical protein
VTFGSEPVHSTLIFDPEESEMNKIHACHGEDGEVASVAKLPEPVPSGGLKTVVGFADVGLEGIGRPEPFRGEWEAVGVVRLRMRDHRAKGAPRFAITPRAKRGELTRRPLCRR